MLRAKERDYIERTSCHITGSTREFYETVLSVSIYKFIIVIFIIITN